MGEKDTFAVDKKSGIPVWIQVKNRVTYEIVSGVFRPGEKLPTVRDLAAQLNINYHTVNKVYQDLERDGLVEKRVGSGTFVTEGTQNAGFPVDDTASMLTSEYVEKSLSLGLTPVDIALLVARNLHLNIEIHDDEEDGRE